MVKINLMETRFIKSINVKITGIDLGVLQSNFDTVLQQSLYYFITIVLLYFVQSKALLAIGLVGETYVKKVRQT